jgi:hypothetical protein
VIGASRLLKNDFASFRGAPPISGLPEIGVSDTQVG